MIAFGLLTQGAANRYGRLIDQLGDRQFLQIKIDSTWDWNGRDIVREKLQIWSGAMRTSVSARLPAAIQIPVVSVQTARNIENVRQSTE